MELYTLSVVAFISVLAVLVYADRKNIKRESVVFLRKTKRGRKLLREIAFRFPRFWKYFGNVGVFVCFLLSLYVFLWLVLTTFNIFTTPKSTSGIVLLLPSPTPKTSAGPAYFAIPLWHWVIVILFVSLIHEGMHGIMAARERIRIRSLGMGLLAIILFAFVEPDEKSLRRKKVVEQLRVYAAGPYSNLIFGFIFILLLTFIFTPAFFSSRGVSFMGYYSTTIDKSCITNVSFYERNPEMLVLNCGEKSYFIPKSKWEEYKIKKEEKGFYSLIHKSISSNFSPRIKIPVFVDYPAVRNNITGTIVRVNNCSVKSVEDLKKCRLRASETVEVETRSGNESKIYRVKLGEMPEPELKVGFFDTVLINLQQLLPFNILHREPKSWEDAVSLKKFWMHVMKKYPALRKMAREEIKYVEEKEFERPGFLGISGIYDEVEIKEGMEGGKGMILFFYELLHFLVLINIGIGLANLLPIKIADGGRMWEVALNKLLGKGRGARATDFISKLVIFLIVVNILNAFI